MLTTAPSLFHSFTNKTLKKNEPILTTSEFNSQVHVYILLTGITKGVCGSRYHTPSLPMTQFEHSFGGKAGLTVLDWLVGHIWRQRTFKYLVLLRTAEFCRKYSQSLFSRTFQLDRLSLADNFPLEKPCKRKNKSW